MPVGTRIIGLGQPAAGDDGIGIAVARRLRNDTFPGSVEVHEVSDPVQLINLLNEIDRAILIDAVVSNGEPGHITCLAADSLAKAGVKLISSHGISIAQILELAHTLAPHNPPVDIHIVGITIKQPERYSLEMTPPIRAAVSRATAVIHELLEHYNEHDDSTIPW